MQPPLSRLGRRLWPIGSRRHYVHDAESTALQLAQDGRQRSHCPGLNVVQQQHALALRPMVQKVAFTHCAARMSSTCELCRGSGPSSKVSTTSWSRNGNVSPYCIVPMRGCSVGSTTRVRAVPSASGLPGHSAATAE